MNSNRRNKEKLEIYLTNLLLAYRPIFLITGLVFIAISIATLSYTVTTSAFLLMLAFSLLLLVYSYQTTLLCAKFLTWIGIIEKGANV